MESITLVGVIEILGAPLRHIGAMFLAMEMPSVFMVLLQQYASFQFPILSPSTNLPYPLLRYINLPLHPIHILIQQA